MNGKATGSTSSTPNAGMSMSPAARSRMRGTEKTIYHYYNDMKRKGGNCTWGAGMLAHKGVCTKEELGRQVTAKMVSTEFERRVAEAEGAVRRNVTVKLNQDQFDALCSLTYNAGATGSSTVYKRLNTGDFEGAADWITSMNKVGIRKNGKLTYVLAPGLIKRREEESAPFRTDAQQIKS